MKSSENQPQNKFVAVVSQKANFIFFPIFLLVRMSMVTGAQTYFVVLLRGSTLGIHCFFVLKVKVNCLSGRSRRERWTS